MLHDSACDAQPLRLARTQQLSVAEQKPQGLELSSVLVLHWAREKMLQRLL
jgi:hypothetical protein